MPSYNPAASSHYSSHPIQIPPEFPKILKQYTKAAIRTQPADLLLWSASYFRCLSNGEVPPTKERLEYPPPETNTGLTPGFLRVLHKQVGHLEVVNLTTLKAKWRGVCLSLKFLEEILQSANCTTPYIKWKDFLVESAIFILQNSDENANAEVSEEKQNFSKQKQSIKISSVMQILIEVMAERSEGVATNLTDKDFIDMLKLVGKRRNVDKKKMEEIEEYFRKTGKRQSGILTFENLSAHDCPNLD